MLERLPTDELAELIANKREVLEQLRQLARHQGDLIAAGELPKLMSVLAAKDALLRQLLDLEQQLNPFRQEDPEQRVWRDSEARRRCQLVAARCDSLLSELMLLEKQGEQDLCRRRDETAQQLQGMHAAGEARQAYGAHAGPTAKVTHFDFES